MRTLHSVEDVIHLVTFSTLLLSYLAPHLTLAADNSADNAADKATLQTPKLQTGSPRVEPPEQQTGSQNPYNYPQYPYPLSQYPGSYPYQYQYPQGQYYQYPIPPPVGYGYPHVSNNESPLSGSTGLAANGNAGSGIPNAENINPNTGGVPIAGSNVPQNGGVSLPQNVPYPSYYGSLGYQYRPYG